MTPQQGPKRYYRVCNTTYSDSSRPPPQISPPNFLSQNASKYFKKWSSRAHWFSKIQIHKNLKFLKLSKKKNSLV